MINLIVGDWGGDGHGKTATYSFEVNRTHAEIAVAYSKGSAMVHDLITDKFDFRNPGSILDYAADSYEDNTVPREIARALECFGIGSYTWEPDKDYSGYMIEYCKDDDSYSIAEGSEGFAELYLAIAKLGDPQLEYKKVQFPSITIGGYGLFY